MPFGLNLMTRQDIHNSDIPELCRSCEARHGGICGALNPEQLTELSKHTKRVRVSSGDELLSAEEPIDKYANVLRGVVKLSKLLEDGRQQIVGLQFAPDLLGRPFGETSTVTAEAATDAELCVFSKTALEGAVSGSHAVTTRLHEQALRELDDARDWMLTLGRKTAREKVASFIKLIVVAARPDRETDEQFVRLTLPLTRSEMADFLGLTIETVSRQMTALRKDNVIEVGRGQDITVLDLNRLVTASGS